MSQPPHHHHAPPSFNDSDNGEGFGRGAIAAYPRHASSASSSSVASITGAATDAHAAPSSQRHSSSRSEAQKERVSTACTYCRFRKVKCDGGLPSCSFCQHMGRAGECEYAKVSEEENQQLRKRKRELRARRAAEKEQQRQQLRKESGGKSGSNTDRRLQQRQQRGPARRKGTVSPTFTASSSSSSSLTAPPSVLSQSFPQPPASSSSSITSPMATSLSGLPAELANTISPQFLAFLPPHASAAASHRDMEHTGDPTAHQQHSFPSYREQQQQQHRQYTHSFHGPPPPPHSASALPLQQQQQQRSSAAAANPGSHPGHSFEVFSYDRPSGILAPFRAPAPTDTAFRVEHSGAAAAPLSGPHQQQHFDVEPPVLDWSFRSFRSFREHSAAASDVNTLVPADTFAIAPTAAQQQPAPTSNAEKHAPAELYADAMESTMTTLKGDGDDDVTPSLSSSPSSLSSYLPSNSPCSSAWSSTTSPTIAHTSGASYKPAKSAIECDLASAIISPPPSIVTGDLPA